MCYVDRVLFVSTSCTSYFDQIHSPLKLLGNLDISLSALCSCFIGVQVFT